ncbi:MAG TPA: hypothetical protein VHL11_04810, partial [Phototrophicaceae bacterium]|nr:hypothetical protein [Phototrophicaceae bacterium]
PSSHSFSSLQATLVHILDIERGWRLFLQGQEFQSDFKAADFPTVAELRQCWQDEERAMWNYLDSLSDEAVAGILRYPDDETGVMVSVCYGTVSITLSIMECSIAAKPPPCLQVTDNPLIGWTSSAFWMNTDWRNTLRHKNRRGAPVCSSSNDLVTIFNWQSMYTHPKEPL